MENEELIIKNAYKALSDDIKNIISSSEWLKKVKEIAQKYSLNEEQTTDLGYEILFTFLNLQSPDLLNETIKEELDISSILAEQIVEEVEERIFSWAMKKITPKEFVSFNTLDTPPPNLPGEIIEDHPLPPMDSEPLFAKNQQRPLRDTVADFFAKPETIETTVTEPTTLPKPEPTNTTPTFISKKLSQPSTISTQARTPQSYTVDPYREPVE